MSDPVRPGQETLLTTMSIERRGAMLEQARTAKMARSAHAYVRGNTAKFYERLATSPVARRVPAGPAIWICGDCHLGNLGPLSEGSGDVEIQIRDLEQTVIGNPAHDLIRLGLSLATAARGSDLPGVTTARMVEEKVDGYEHAMGERPDGDAGPQPDVVRSVKRYALGRRWRQLARERIKDGAPTIPLAMSAAVVATTILDAVPFRSAALQTMRGCQQHPGVVIHPAGP